MNSAMFFIPVSSPNPSQEEMLDAAIQYVADAVGADPRNEILSNALDTLHAYKQQAALKEQIDLLEKTLASLRAQLRSF